MKNNPITAFLSVVIVILFSLYYTSILKTIPCEKDMKSIFISQFIHTDFFHLLANLYGFYALSRVELMIGPKKFFILVMFLLIFNTIFEFILHYFAKTPCSIGISGILYGIVTFELLSKKIIDYHGILSIFLSIYASYKSNINSSLYGHLIGGFTGILGSLIFKNFFQV
jgi:membrane associated rhomboid family serine protease